VNVFYKGRSWEVERVGAVVGGVGSYKSGVTRVVVDVGYGGIIVVGAR